MKLSAPVFITLLSLPFTHLTRAESPSFAPEEDSQLTVTFEQRSESELVETESLFMVNGDEHDNSTDSDGLEVERTFSESIAFTDEFISVEDGMPTRISRVFDTISSTSSENVIDEEGEEHESENERTSELVGKSISLAWDEDEEDYVKSFGEDEDDADEDLLDKLEFTGYLVGLLPDEEVSEGDEWQVGAEVFRTLIYPGGVLSYVDVDGEEEEEDEDAIAKQADWEEQYSENFTGEITLEHLGMREDDDGGQWLVIGIDLMVETYVEQEEEIGVVINEEEGEGTQTDTFTYTTSMTGELLWSLEQSRPASLTLSGEHSSEFVEARDMAAGGVQIEMTTTRLFEGERTIEYTIE